MKKIILILIVLALLSKIATAQTVTTRINDINVDFNRKIATVEIGTGYYSNNVWIPTGLNSIATIQEPAFDQVVNTLTQENALNMNTLISTLLTELIPQPVLSTNVNWDQVAQLKAAGDNWSDIKNIVTGINWSAVAQLNNLQDTNWNNLSGINWNNWAVREDQGENWEDFIKTNGN